MIFKIRNLISLIHRHKLITGIIFVTFNYALISSTEALSYFPSAADYGNTCPTFPVDVSSEGGLNEAIDCFNAASDGDYVINVLTNVSLVNDTAPINNSRSTSLTVNGNNNFIDGAGTVRILKIETGDVTINDWIFQHGESSTDGGGIYIGANAVVTITASAILDNTAASGNGGGIYNLGDLTINRSEIKGNFAVRGGGVSNEGRLNINESEISNNNLKVSDFGQGGGIDSYGQATINNSTISNNSAAYGGGIENRKEMTITNSTISGNMASFDGAGIGNHDELIVGNSTISGNSAIGRGGGVNSWCHGSTMIIHGTIAENSSGSRGSGLYSSCGDIVLRNSIVANNTGDADCYIWTSDVDVTNLDSDGTCLNAIESENVNLGPLQDNGGVTLTHGLLPGSDAIDAAGSIDCTSAPVRNIDQRGIARPKGPLCDIGAYETEQIETVCPGFPINVETEDELNTAITCFNGVQSGSPEIILMATINLSKMLTIINNPWGVDLQISGNSFAIDGDNRFRTLYVEAGPVSITNLTLQNGYADEHGGALFLATDSIITLVDTQIINSSAGQSGAGIYNQGNLEMTRTLVSNNHNISNDYDGGGLFNQSSATAKVVDTVFAENSAGSGGGIQNEGALTIQSSTILRNRSHSPSYGGGGLYSVSDETVNIINSTISGNFGDAGGGVLVWKGSVNITNSTIFNNTTNGDGAAVYNVNGSITLLNTIVSNPFKGQDCKSGSFGEIVANGSNLDSDGSCGDAIQSSDIKLGRLQNYGGFADTHSLLPGSAAIDAGDNAICNDVAVNGVDQRDVTRSEGTSCDIGAFEKGLNEDTSVHTPALQFSYLPLAIR